MVQETYSLAAIAYHTAFAAIILHSNTSALLFTITILSPQNVGWVQVHVLWHDCLELQSNAFAAA